MKTLPLKWILPLIALLLVASCGPARHRPPAPSFTERFGEKGLKLDRAMAYYASFFNRMVLTARVRIEADGRTLPSLKTIMRLSMEKEGSRLRATGLGPFGITVFDGLLHDGRLMLAVPRLRGLFVADIQGELGRKMNMAGDAWGLVLNPWSFHCAPSDEVTACPELVMAQTGKRRGDLLCIEERGLVVAFDADRLLPLMISGPEMSVTYSGHDSTRLTPPYPREISMLLKMDGHIVKLKARILSLMPKSSPMEVDEGFEDYTSRLTIQPISGLFRGVK